MLFLTMFLSSNYENLVVILKKQNKDLLVLNLDYPQVPKDYVLVKMYYSVFVIHN